MKIRIDSVGLTLSVSPGCIHKTIPGPNYNSNRSLQVHIYIVVLYEFDYTLFLIVNADDDELNSCVGFLCVTASRLILAVKTCII